MSSRKPGKWGDAAWALGMAAQGGLIVAGPVVGGLALGFWLDNQFNTLPFISLLLTLIGAVVGPIMLYRWVTSSVAARMESRTDIEKKQSEEKPE